MIEQVEKLRNLVRLVLRKGGLEDLDAEASQVMRALLIDGAWHDPGRAGELLEAPVKVVFPIGPSANTNSRSAVRADSSKWNLVLRHQAPTPPPWPKRLVDRPRLLSTHGSTTSVVEPLYSASRRSPRSQVSSDL